MTDTTASATGAEIAGLGHNNPPPFHVEIAERHAPLKLRVEALIADGKTIPANIETEEDHHKAVKFGNDRLAIEKEIGQAHEEEKKPLAEKVKVIDTFFLTRGLKGALEPVARDVARANGAYLQRLADERRRKAEAEAQAAREEAARREAEAAALEAEGRHTEASVRMEGAVAQDQHAAQLAQRAAAPQAELARSYSTAGAASLVVRAKPVVDMETIDLNRLRPYLAEEAVIAAVRAFAKARKFTDKDLLEGKLSVTGLTFESEATARTR